MHVWDSRKRKSYYTGSQTPFSDHHHGPNPPLSDFSNLYFPTLCRALKTNSLLIMVCIAASIWAWAQEPAFAEQNLIFSLRNFENGRVWTLVAALFVHANVFHLVGNMLFLFVFGNTLEKSVGSDKLLAIFFVGGFLSFIVSPAFLPRGICAPSSR